MTVIAYDGKKLVGDKAATICGLQRTVTKIFKVPGGMVGFSGDPGHIFLVLEWMRKGRPAHGFPRPPEDTDHCNALFVTTEGRVLQYEKSEFPMEVEETYDAIGCGRDYAMGVMFMGGDAVKAVEVASHFDSGCGRGLDIITLKEIQDEAALRQPEQHAQPARGGRKGCAAKRPARRDPAAAAGR